MISGSTLVAATCILLGAVAILDLLRSFLLFYRWRRGRLDPHYEPTVVWRAPLRIGLGVFGIGAGLLDLGGLGVFAIIAGALLAGSVFITRQPRLLRLKPVRVLRGLRLVAGLVAFVQGTGFLTRG